MSAYRSAANEDALRSMIADEIRAQLAMLAAHGTPAPALDESAIRADERERCAVTLDEMTGSFIRGSAVYGTLRSAAELLRKMS